MKPAPPFFLVVLVLALGATPAHAAIVLAAAEVGSDMVLTGSGTMNLAALSFLSTASGPAQVGPANPVVVVGPSTMETFNLYLPPSGPTNFGTEFQTLATSGTGDRFGLMGTGFGLALAVPTGYTSGFALNGTSTFANESFASLGMTPGTYVWTWGTGVNADSITLSVSTASVPEPTSLTLWCLGALACAVAYRRGKQAV